MIRTNPKILKWKAEVEELSKIPSKRLRRTKACQGAKGYTLGADNVGKVDLFKLFLSDNLM